MISQPLLQKKKKNLPGTQALVKGTLEKYSLPKLQMINYNFAFLVLPKQKKSYKINI